MTDINRRHEHGPSRSLFVADGDSVEHHQLAVSPRPGARRGWQGSGVLLGPRLTPPGHPPVHFDPVPHGYDRDQVDGYIHQLFGWADQQANRAESAERTLQAALAQFVLPGGGAGPLTVTTVAGHPQNAGDRASPAPSISAGPFPRSLAPAPVCAQLEPGVSSTVTPLRSVGGTPNPGRRRRRLLITSVIAVVASTIAAGLVLTGLVSGADPVATLVLTPAQVKGGDTYFATASGLDAGEPVRISWTGPTNGVMDTIPADRSGTRRERPVIERDPPGTYVLYATGLRSGRTASASLQVLAADPPPDPEPNPGQQTGRAAR